MGWGRGGREDGGEERDSGSSRIRSYHFSWKLLLDGVTQCTPGRDSHISCLAHFHVVGEEERAGPSACIVECGGGLEKDVELS